MSKTCGSLRCTAPHDPCVCVRPQREKSGAARQRKQQSQEGGVCDYSHKAVLRFVLLCCCFVAMHIASRSGGAGTQSTSSLLAQSGGWCA